MATSPRRAGIYCRLSYAPDGSLEKVERQEGDCRQLADRLVWPVSDEHVFVDNSRSAWQRNRKRPAWDALLAAIEAGDIDAVIVYHGDRLIRQPYDLERLIGIADSKGVRVASPSGTRNLDSPDDRFILRIEAAQACRESDNTSRRVKRGWAARAKAGRPIGGGKRPFGFEGDYITIRQEEAEILAGAVDRLLAGQSQGGVLRWMNECSTTTQGGVWVGRSLKHLLRSPRIAGLVEHNGTLHEAVWEPIISTETWEDVKLLLARNAEEYGYAGRERRYLLTGVATCPSGHGLVTKPSGGRNRTTSRVYWCKVKGCPTQVGRNVEHLDRYVTGHVLRVLQDPAFAEEVSAADPSVAPQIAALERRKREVEQQILDLADHPELDAGILVRSLAGFDRKIDELRGRHATTARRRLLGRLAGIGAEEWEELPIDLQADAVRALVEVTVLPTTHRGPGFDVGAVRVERRPLD